MKMASSLDRRKWSVKNLSTICASLMLMILPVAYADKTAADYFIKSLPGQPDGPLLKMHAG